MQRKDFDNDGVSRQSGSQTIILAHTLLFLIEEWIITCENEDLDKHINCFVTLFTNFKRLFSV